MSTSEELTHTKADVARTHAIVGVYCGAFALAEIVTAIVGSPVGVVVHAGVAVTALHQHSIPTPSADALDRSRTGLDAFLLSMAIASVARIVVFALPLFFAPRAVWPLIVAIPTAVGIAGIRLADEPRGWRGSWFTRAHPAREAAVALSGLPLSLLAYVAVRPPMLIANASLLRTGVAAASLLVLGVVEETLYRGLVQRASVALFGRWGVVVAAVVATAATIGDRSWAASLLAGGLALLFGSWVYRTHCLVGVAVAHALILIGMLLVWPRIL